jgi:hypothetical protein
LRYFLLFLFWLEPEAKCPLLCQSLAIGWNSFPLNLIVQTPRSAPKFHWQDLMDGWQHRRLREVA